MKSSSAMPVAVAVGSVAAPLNTATKSRVPSAVHSHMIPSPKPKSPTRLTMNAFLPACGRGRPRVPEADEQVGAEADRLPEDVEEQEVAGQHQHRHREHEQVQVREEARVAGVVVHVADRVEVDQEADAGDDQQHDAGERVDVGGDAGLEVAGDDPREERVGEGAARPRAGGDRARGQEAAGQCRHRDPVGAPARQTPEEDVEEGSGQRKGGNQPECRHRVNLATGPGGVKQRWARPDRLLSFSSCLSGPGRRRGWSWSSSFSSRWSEACPISAGASPFPGRGRR